MSIGRRAYAKTFAVVLLVVAFIGCNAILGIDTGYHLVDGDGGLGLCTLNSDCTGGNVCIFETCSAPCHQDVDCSVGSRCLTTMTDARTACVSPKLARCSDNDCPSGTECSGGTCRTTCSDQTGCRDDQVCSGDGVCVGTDSKHDTPTGSGGNTGAGGAGGSGGQAASGASGMLGAGGRSVGAPADSGVDANDAGPDAGAGGRGQGGMGGNGGAPDPCVGVNCDNPAAADCVDSNTKRTYQPGSCSEGSCVFPHTDTPCTFGCNKGDCKPDPCASVSCTTPPASSCADANHFNAYDTTGTCSGGNCTYKLNVTACSCMSNACTTDPCTTIVCRTPPAATCTDPDTQRKYASTGTCSNGSCTYAPTDVPCTFGCAAGACKPDPCAAVACKSPPSAGCPAQATLRTYVSPGTCSDGLCSYMHTDTSCTMQCTTIPVPACVCPAGYTGTGVGPGGCTDIDECATNNGGCGSAAFWKCNNQIGAPPVCADINECAANNGGCGAASAWTCMNVTGGPPACTDKNECTLNTDDCDTSPVATCANTMGNFTCACPGVYIGTGHGTNGCTCPIVTACDDSTTEQNGSRCGGPATMTTCTDQGGCQIASTTTCTNLANEGCKGAYPNAKCEQAVGFPTDGGGTGNLGGDFLFAVPVTLTKSLTLTRLGLVARSAATGVRMAVYADANGLGTWKASALTGTVAAGRNEYVINDPPATSPVTLAPGAYWIAVVVQSSTALAQGGTNSVRYKAWSPWNTPFPVGALTPTTSDTLPQPNFYLVGVP